MSEGRRQILEMLANGKITADEAERLIAAFEKQSSAEANAGGLGAPKPRANAKYLRVVVESDEHGSPTKVNIRVPMQLLRAGVKLASLIPVQAQTEVNKALREQGLQIDLSQLKPENLEELIENLNDLTVDVDDRNNKVRVFCE